MIVPLLLMTAVAVTVAVLVRRAASRAYASERRYRALAAQAPDVTIALVDRRLIFTLVEGDAFERNGWTAGGVVVGQPVADVITAHRVEELRPHLQAALEGVSTRLEWWSSHADAIFRIDVLPFREDDKAPIRHALLALRDISEERNLQETLEEQRGFLSAVLTQLQNRVTVCDADGNLHDFGAEHYDRDELHPLEWAERFGLHHPDGRPFGPHEAPLLRALRGEVVRDVEIRRETPDGAIALLASGGPVRAPDGRLLGAVVVDADLTAFRDAEGRLRRSEERHRRVVESITDCVFETDDRGRWTHLSEAWTLATGIPVEDSLGRPAAEFVHPDDRVEQARALAPLLVGERAALKLAHRFLTATGAERWAEVQVRAISGWDGLPTGFVGVMRDVTEERRTGQHSAAEQAVVRVLAGADAFDDAGPALIEALARELEWDGAELWRMTGDECLRRCTDWTAPGVALPHFMDAGATLACEVGDDLPGLAWMSREPLWKPDVSDGEQFARVVESAKDGIRSSVALPLRVAGVPVGVVVLVSRTPREPEPGLVRLLESVGGQVAQLLQRRAAESRVAEQAEDLKTLSRVAHELATQTDMFAARTTLCRAVRDVTRSSSVTLWEPRESSEELEVTAAVGAAVRGMTVPIGAHSVTVDAFLTGELVFVPDVAGHPRHSRWHEVAGALSGAWVPVVHDGRCVGVLAVGWTELRPALRERDEELLRLLAAEAAITIHRTDLLARLQATARTDPLTGLPNRRVWDEDLERELVRARRHGGSLCLAMVDLDRFKAFNDDHGHQAGDELLAAAATAWRPALRMTDTLARYGGEEFAVLLPHSDEEGALAVIQRLLDAVPLGQTASAGVAVWDGSETADELLARADAALYEAKGAGRAQVLLAAAPQSPRIARATSAGGAPLMT